MKVILILSLFFLPVKLFSHLNTEASREEIRIVTLDPAASELVIALKLDKKLVGIDPLSKREFSSLSELPVVSKVTQVDYESLIQHKVSHVISYNLGFIGLEPKLKSLGIQHISLKNKKLEDLFSNIRRLSRDFAVDSKTLEESLQAKLKKIEKPKKKKANYLVVVSHSPHYVVGKQNFIDDGLSKCGLSNAVSQAGYPLYDMERLVRAKVDHIFFMSDVIDKHGKDHVFKRWKKYAPQAQYQILNSDSFSRLGPSFIESLKNLCATFNTLGREQFGTKVTLKRLSQNVPVYTIR